MELHLAVINNNMGEAEKLIASNPELVSKRDNHNQLPLHWAAKLNNLQAVTLLVAANSNLIDACDDGGNSPLFYAMKKGSQSMQLFLLDKYIVPSDHNIDSYEFCKILKIAFHSHENVVRIMLERNGDLLRVPGDNRFSIYKVFKEALEYGNENMISMLLDARPQFINDINGDLIYYAIRDNSDTIEALVKSRGEFINLLANEFNHGNNLLHMAAEHGKERLFETILGLRPELIDTVTKAPQWDMVGKDYPYKQNILHLAAFKCNAELIEKILKLRPAFFNGVDSKGQSPFFNAVQRGNAAAVDVMLGHKPELIDTIDMHSIISNRYSDLLKLLIYIKPALSELIDSQMVHDAVKNYNFKILQTLLTIKPDLIQGTDGTTLVESLIHLVKRDSWQLKDCLKDDTFQEIMDFIIEKNSQMIFSKNPEGQTIWDTAKTMVIEYIREKHSIDDTTKLFISKGTKSLDFLAPKLLRLPADVKNKICDFIFDNKVINFSYIKHLVNMFSDQNQSQLNITEVLTEETQGDSQALVIHTGESLEIL